MNIQELPRKINPLAPRSLGGEGETIGFDKDGQAVPKRRFQAMFWPAILVLALALGFGIGRLSAGQGRQGVQISYDPAMFAASAVSGAEASPPAAAGQVYASSKGTRYYYLTCKSTVSDKNKVVFASAKAAEAAGYSLAAACHPN